jgi:uncharacterized protein (DUF1330 family)
MPAYVIVDVEINDPDRYREYVQMVPESIEAYGGRFIVRGGQAENLEGDWEPKRVVVIEFESLERAKEWWASDQYAAPKALRQSASTARMIVAKGV